jgi:hypothetical protein
LMRKVFSRSILPQSYSLPTKLLSALFVLLFDRVSCPALSPVVSHLCLTQLGAKENHDLLTRGP